MNILVIEDHASSKKGGAERSMRYFCEYLTSQKDIKLYFVYHLDGDLVTDENKNIYLDCKKVQLYPVRRMGLLKWLKSLRSLVDYCKQHKIDIVFTHIIHAFFIIRLTKILCSFKYVQYFKWTPSTPHIGLFGGWGLKGVDGAYAVSKFTMSYWQNLNSSFQIENIIPDGIPNKNLTSGLIKELKDENNKRNLLFAGRIYEGKGLHKLIEAIASFKDFDIFLNIYGYFDTTSPHPDLDYHLYIKRLINENKLESKVCFCGFVNDLSIYIKKSDLVIVPSVLPDAQPLVLLESMQCKKICIGSKAGGIPEIFIEDLSILLFEPNNTESLVLKISEILKLPVIDTHKIEDLLFQRFISNYTLDKTNTSILNNLISIL